jgi:hypothetical protein
VRKREAVSLADIADFFSFLLSFQNYFLILQPEWNYSAIFRPVVEEGSTRQKKCCVQM